MKLNKNQFEIIGKSLKGIIPICKPEGLGSTTKSSAIVNTWRALDKESCL